MVTPISKAEHTTSNPSTPANEQLSSTSRAVLRLNLELQRQITSFKRNTGRLAELASLSPSPSDNGSFFLLNTLVRNRPEAAIKLLPMFPNEMASENLGLAKLYRAFETKNANDLPTADQLTNDLANLCAVDSMPDKSFVTDLLHQLISVFIEPARLVTESGRRIAPRLLLQLASLSTVLLKAQSKIAASSVTTIGNLEIPQLDLLIGACDLALQTEHPDQERNSIEMTRNILERKRDAILLIQMAPIELEHMDETIRSDRDVVLRAVQIMGWALSFASEPLKNDKEIVLKAVNQNGWALGFASPQMRNDKQVVMAAVRNNGNAFQFASEQLKTDPEVAAAALRNAQTSFIFMSQVLRNDPGLRSIAFARNR